MSPEVPAVAATPASAAPTSVGSTPGDFADACVKAAENSQNLTELAEALIPLLRRATPDHGTVPAQVSKILVQDLTAYGPGPSNTKWSALLFDGTLGQVKDLPTRIDSVEKSTGKVLTRVAVLVAVFLVIWGITVFADAAQVGVSSLAFALTTLAAIAAIAGLTSVRRNAARLALQGSTVVIAVVTTALVAIVAVTAVAILVRRGPTMPAENPAVIISVIAVLAAAIGGELLVWRARASVDSASAITTDLRLIMLLSEPQKPPPDATQVAGDHSYIEWIGAQIEVTAEKQSRLSTRWTWTHYLVGIAALGTAGIATALAAQTEALNDLKWLIPVLAALAALASGALTTLNPGARLQEARTAQLTLEALRRETLLYPRLHRPADHSRDDEFLKYLVGRYEQAVGAPDTRHFDSPVVPDPNSDRDKAQQTHTGD